MSEPFLGEIALFAGNFAIKNYAYCSGQLMGIAQNTALFSLFGTYYGGDGRTTFGLPDLRGRLPLGMGQGPGLSPYTIGEQTGAENVTLTLQQMPIHSHIPTANINVASSLTAGGNLPATLQAPWTGYWIQDANKTGSPVPFSPVAVGPVGSNQPHENRMPALAISILVALVGIFPSRN